MKDNLASQRMVELAPGPKENKRKIIGRSETFGDGRSVRRERLWSGNMTYARQSKKAALPVLKNTTRGKKKRRRNAERKSRVSENNIASFDSNDFPMQLSAKLDGMLLRQGTSTGLGVLQPPSSPFRRARQERRSESSPETNRGDHYSLSYTPHIHTFL